MRYILFLIASFFVIGVYAQSEQRISQIELNKISRGYQEQVLITPDSIHTFLDNSMSGQPARKRARKTEPQEWKKLIESLQNIPLKEIPSLPSPTMKRAHDAAQHSTLTITTKDGKSYPHGFDDDDPHKALRPLMKTIRELSGPLDVKQ